MANLADSFVEDAPGLADTFVEDAGDPQFTPTETFGLQATNLFGGGDAIGAVVNSIVRGGKYDEWRKRFATARQLAAAQNPIASTAGRVTSFASELAVGGAVGKAVQGAAGAA